MFAFKKRSLPFVTNEEKLLLRLQIFHCNELEKPRCVVTLARIIVPYAQEIQRAKRTENNKNIAGQGLSKVKLKKQII
jgi:hypothetical protein